MSKKHLVPLALIPFVPLALLTGCSPSYEGETPAAFASVACSTWLQEGALDTLTDGATIEALSGTGEEQRDQAIVLAEQIVSEWEARRDTIAAAQPAVENGAEIIGLFSDHYNTRIDISNDFIDEFRGYSVETGEFDQLVKQGAEELFLNIDGTSLDADDPFLPIDNQQVVDAMLKDDVCTTFLSERDW